MSLQRHHFPLRSMLFRSPQIRRVLFFCVALFCETDTQIRNINAAAAPLSLASVPMELILKPFYIAEDMLAPINNYLAGQRVIYNFTEGFQNRAFLLLRNTTQHISEATHAQEILEPALVEAIKNPETRADIAKHVLSVISSVVQLPQVTRLTQTVTLAPSSKVSTAPATTTLRPQVIQYIVSPPIAPTPIATLPLRMSHGQPILSSVDWWQPASAAGQLPSYNSWLPFSREYVNQWNGELPWPRDPSLMSTSDAHNVNLLPIISVTTLPPNTLGPPSRTETLSADMETLSAGSYYPLDGTYSFKFQRYPHLRLTSIAPLPLTVSGAENALQLVAVDVANTFGKRLSEHNERKVTDYIRRLLDSRYPYSPEVFASIALNTVAFVNATEHLDCPQPETFRPRKLARLFFFRWGDTPEAYAKIVSDYVRLASILYTHKRLRALIASPGLYDGLPKGIPLSNYPFPSFSNFLRSAGTVTSGLFQPAEEPDGRRYSTTNHSLEEANNFGSTGSSFLSESDTPYSPTDSVFLSFVDLLEEYEQQGVDVFDIWISEFKNELGTTQPSITPTKRTSETLLNDTKPAQLRLLKGASHTINKTFSTVANAWPQMQKSTSFFLKKHSGRTTPRGEVPLPNPFPSTLLRRKHR